MLSRRSHPAAQAPNVSPVVEPAAWCLPLCVALLLSLGGLGPIGRTGEPLLARPVPAHPAAAWHPFPLGSGMATRSLRQRGFPNPVPARGSMAPRNGAAGDESTTPAPGLDLRRELAELADARWFATSGSAVTTAGARNGG
jgi:hypothetical protein